MGSIVLASIALLLFAFGRWGQLRAADLVVDLAPESRARKERSIRRGGAAWQIVAVMLFLLALSEVWLKR
jgi:hypothetical protein